MWQRSIAGFKPIADPRLSHDVVRRIFVAFQFFSELSNKYSQVFRLFHAFRSPNGGEEFLVRNDSSRVPGKIYKQVEFLRR